MSKYYIAYGSNLNKEQMVKRCPDAEFVGPTSIPDFYLLFRGSPGCGVATIEPREGSVVQAGIWKISRKDEQALDRYEGYPAVYHKETLDCHVDGKSMEAMVYVMDVRYDLSYPGWLYFKTIEQGYHDCYLNKKGLYEALEESIQAVDQEMMGMEMK